MSARRTTKDAWSPRGRAARAAAMVVGTVAIAAALEPAFAQTVYGPAPAAPEPAQQAPTQQARARPWFIEPSIGAEFDLTDNVDLAPSSSRKSDFVTQITPALLVHEKGAHTSLDGTIALPILLYARTGGENNYVRPEVSLTGNAELVPRFFYVDGSVQVSQQYLSPFGARPQNLVNATNNRYTSQSYQVAPFIKGQPAGGLSYELRDRNTWTNETNTSIPTNRAYTNEVIGNLTREPQPFGWALEYDRASTRFPDQEPQITDLSRGRALWKPDPQLELSATAGYEDNQFPLVRESGATYGAGFKWHASERTEFDVDWEHRFFGGSYHVSFEHRTPLSVWSLRASRDITTYPQQVANLAAGSDVSTLLNQLFSSRVSDPAQRQQLVDQLIRDRGLPAQLSSSLVLFNEQVTLQEELQASVALLGARNAVFISGYRSRTEPVGPQEVLDLLTALQTNNTQTGGGVVWTYKLTQLYTLSTTGDYAHTVPNGDVAGASTGTTDQWTFRLVVSAPLSPLTDIFAGARYQKLNSDVTPGYREAAVFAGLRHVFR